MNKKKINLIASIIYLISIFFSGIIFFILLNHWVFPYNFLQLILPVTMIFFGIYFVLKLPVQKINLFMNRSIIIRILFLFLLTSLIFIFFIINRFPLYHYWVFFIFSLLFSLSNYFSLYFVSIIFSFWIFFSFQVLYIQQEILLNWIEKKIYVQWLQEIHKDIEVYKKDGTISIKKNNIMIQLSIPNNFKEISVEEEKNFPAIYIGKPDNKELPIFSCFIIDQQYPLFMLDLRIQTILMNLKKSERIENYESTKNLYLSTLYKELRIENQFYQFFDKFYAANIQLGYYAIQLDDKYLILWIREIPKIGFPHDPEILEIFLLVKNRKPEKLFLLLIQIQKNKNESLYSFS